MDTLMLIPLTPDVTIEFRPEMTRPLATKLLALHHIGWPESDATVARIMWLARQPEHHLAVLFGCGPAAYPYHTPVGMLSLIETQSFRRTALLYEELVLEPALRASHPTLPWAIDTAVLMYARACTHATRIEGTVGEDSPLWVVHRRNGFDDRRQRAFVWTYREGQ